MNKQEIIGCPAAITRRLFLRGLAGASVAGIIRLGGASVHPQISENGSIAPAGRVQFGATRLPILRRAEVIVIGGSLAGVAAALEFARAGRKVVLIEQRTYLGREISATLRPWIEPGALDMGEIPEPFSATLKRMGAKPAGGEIPLRMDAFKLALEDLLLEAGVEFFYASLPTEALMNGGAVAGVVIGNKSGRQVITGSMVIDTTPTAVTARVAGAAFEARGSGSRRYVRTLELDKVGPLDWTSLAVPEEFGIAGNQVTVHQGYRSAGHVLVECPMELPVERMDLDGMMAREIEARRRSMRVAAYLIQKEPAFGKALLAVCGYELEGRQTERMASPAPEWAAEFKQATLDFKDKRKDAVRWPLEHFAGPAPGLWCIGDAARLESAEHDRLHDPINAALAGAAFARLMLKLRKSGARSAAPRAGLAEAPGAMAEGGLKVGAQERPQRGRAYAMLPAPASSAPIHREVDVLVVGGGTSGATAAGVAAREGMRTVALELNPGLGGTGTIGGVNSYWFGRRCAFAQRNSELVEAVHREIRWTRSQWCIEGKMHALLQDARDSGAEVFFHALAIGTVLEGKRVRGVVAATPYGPMAALAKVTIDATGDGDVAAFAGAKSVYGAARDHIPLWFRLGEYASPGVIRSSFTTPMDTTNIEDATRAILVGRRRGAPTTHDHVAYVTPRESRHIQGEVTLTLRDQLRHRQWPDVVNVHYSNTDIKGLTDSDFIRIGLIPPIQSIEIPYRALLPKGLEGVLVAGKAFSADHDTFTAVRMQSDLENLGGVTALAATQAIRAGELPHQVVLSKLQERLVAAGILAPEQVGRRIDKERIDEAGFRAMLAKLDAGRKLHEYSELKWPFGKKIPFVELCAADPALAVPILEEEHAKASGARKLLIAQALAMHGAKAGVPTLIEEIQRQLAGTALPPRMNNIPNVQLPPDQAACPDVVYLLYALGLARDRRALDVWRRVAELLVATHEEFKDARKCTYYYVDSVCFGAERLGDPDAIPILEKIHDRPALKAQSVKGWTLQPDIMLERRAILEVGLGYALARCGSLGGFEILITYLDDNRAILAEYAHDALARISGRDHGKDAHAWRLWVQQSASRGSGRIG